MSDTSATSNVVKDNPVVTQSNESKQEKQRKRKIFRIELVVNEDELKNIEDNASKMDMTRSEYLRARGLKQIYTRNRQVPPVEIIALIKILSELKRQGNNINQIARKLNSGGSFDRTIHLKATEKLLKMLDKWQK